MYIFAANMLLIEKRAEFRGSTAVARGPCGLRGGFAPGRRPTPVASMSPSSHARWPIGAMNTDEVGNYREPHTAINQAD